MICQVRKGVLLNVSSRIMVYQDIMQKAYRQ